MNDFPNESVTYLGKFQALTNLMFTINVTRLGDLLDFGQVKPLATINLPKSPTF